MRRGAAALAVTIALAGACGTGETSRPPPIDGTVGSSPGQGGGAVDDGDGAGTTGDTTTAAATGGTTGIATGATGIATGTTGVFSDILRGSILTDASLFPLPMNCSLRLHEPGAVDPGTGLSTGPLIDVPVILDEQEQRFDIGLAEVQGIVNMGDLVYVEVRCDVDGDGAFDTVGGWFPLLPAELVELPAEDIDLVVTDLPV